MTEPASPDVVRSTALALPEAVERDHHGRPSFRVGGKIFATLWDPEHVNVMLDEGGILTAVHRHPKACTGFRWGRRLAALQVDLRCASAPLIEELLVDAWEGKAPKRLLGKRSAHADSP